MLGQELHMSTPMLSPTPTIAQHRAACPDGAQTMLLDKAGARTMLLEMGPGDETSEGC